jgi:fructose-1,6-bisphosphatase/inositol monophosphatase family enzyme
VTELPEALCASPYAARLRVAIEAATGAGAALRRIRSATHRGAEVDDQLKTVVDRAAEGWVLGYLHGSFENDAILSEEAFEAAAAPWHAPEAFWTVDALDGTRSFVDGYDGFCVQVAWIERGIVRVGVVHEPVLDRTYVGVEGAGAYLLEAAAPPRRLVIRTAPDWPPAPVFVDSTMPAGPVGAVYRGHAGEFLELGSIGLKLCRVADASADVFAKRLRFKLWDVAPAEVIIAEAGGVVGSWDGSRIPYDTARTHFQDILAAPRGLFELVAHELGPAAAPSPDQR